MFTGDLGAQVASKAIGDGTLDAATLMPYDEGWRTSTMGKAIERNYHIKEYLINLPDDKLNAIIHSAKSLDMKDFSTLTLIKELIKRNPKLVVELAVLRASLV
jgi:digeranylgeranylglycerophospholipid reductase